MLPRPWRDRVTGEPTGRRQRARAPLAELSMSDPLAQRVTIEMNVRLHWRGGRARRRGAAHARRRRCYSTREIELDARGGGLRRHRGARRAHGPAADCGRRLRGLHREEDRCRRTGRGWPTRLSRRSRSHSAGRSRPSSSSASSTSARSSSCSPGRRSRWRTSPSRSRPASSRTRTAAGSRSSSASPGSASGSLRRASRTASGSCSPRLRSWASPGRSRAARTRPGSRTRSASTGGPVIPGRRAGDAGSARSLGIGGGRRARARRPSPADRCRGQSSCWHSALGLAVVMHETGFVSARAESVSVVASMRAPPGRAARSSGAIPCCC